MDAEKLARIHLDCALRLTGRDFLVAWLAETQTTTNTTTSPGRGRRPGAAEDTHRCTWKRTGGPQCKNGRVADSQFCKIHVTKAHLLAGAEANSSTNVEAETVATTASTGAATLSFTSSSTRL
jgi:hypothetical protein